MGTYIPTHPAHCYCSGGQHFSAQGPGHCIWPSTASLLLPPSHYYLLNSLRRKRRSNKTQMIASGRCSLLFSYATNTWKTSPPLTIYSLTTASYFPSLLLHRNHSHSGPQCSSDPADEHLVIYLLHHSKVFTFAKHFPLLSTAMTSHSGFVLTSLDHPLLAFPRVFFILTVL